MDGSTPVACYKDYTHTSLKGQRNRAARVLLCCGNAMAGQLELELPAAPATVL